MCHLKRINYLILILLSISFICKVNALVTPTDRFYVNDYANVLSPETENYIYEKSIELNNVDGTQLVVVTVKDLEGRSIEDYSLELAREFEIGSKEKNNGLLLLLALEEREFRVEVGTGLEGILPDGKTGRFQDQYIIPYLSKNDYDTGIKNGYDAFYNEIVKLNNLELETTLPKSQEGDSVYFDSIMFAIGLGFTIGMLLGQTEKGFKISGVYLLIAIVMVIYYRLKNPIYLIYIVPHIITFSISRLIYGFTKGNRTYSTSNYGGYSSRRSRSSSSRNSNSSFHRGGGGSFSGGGSSRRF
ncbi:MAG: TPM domain-containing protein [Bacilli bacterium]|nr:TPM domain-containing protein [Bacilli bacterium]